MWKCVNLYVLHAATTETIWQKFWTEIDYTYTLGQHVMGYFSYLRNLWLPRDLWKPQIYACKAAGIN